MNRIVEAFGVPRVLLPVIHPVGRDEALASVEVAVAAGVKGVFVINQGMSEKQVLALMMEIRGRHPALWVGVNLLGFSPIEILERGLEAGDGRLDGIWSDNAHIDEDAAQQPEAAAFVAARREVDWSGLYFGGVAFKYQREVADAKLEWAARVARGYMDVVCTSGPGTGHEARVEKVAAMRAGLGSDGALALASGVTPENVGNFLPHVDAYLVGTGIEARLGVLDAERVAALHRLISS
ncbi:MAG: adenine phosphoribosyltransferase [Kofleriaceae bacterium]|nr:MAG: adenine phosphoribosyltransferase [Kofleriaceae bacterium]MBZ0236446.1 adenine phosphoribosyltransferase [Kofleriaceae bacterium]